MKAWWLDHHPMYDKLKFRNSEDFLTCDSIFLGKSLSISWIIPNMDYDSKGRESDFLYQIGGALFVSNKVKHLFQSNISDHLVEFLPISTDRGEYFALNVLNILDCIDVNRSKVDRLPSGRLNGYKEMEFIEEVVKDQDIFRVKIRENDAILDEIYVSDRVRNLIKNSDLKGYQLVDIWDSEITQEEINIKLNVMGERIHTSLIKSFSFDKAMNYIQTNNVIVYSRRSAMKQNENGELMIGELQLEGNYIWFTTDVIPPAFLFEEWGIKERVKTSNILSKLKSL